MSTASIRIDTADCAKLVRKALKAAFPETTFRVKTSRYAGGSSVEVYWLDGPTSEQVSVVTKVYQGSSFDSSQDLKSYHDSELDGQVVHYAADWVSGHRDFSVAFVQTIADQLCERYGLPTIEVTAQRHGGMADWSAAYRVDVDGVNHLSDLIYRELAVRAAGAAPSWLEDDAAVQAHLAANPTRKWCAYCAVEPAREDLEFCSTACTDDAARSCEAAHGFPSKVEPERCKPHGWLAATCQPCNRRQQAATIGQLSAELIAADDRGDAVLVKILDGALGRALASFEGAASEQNQLDARDPFGL